MAYSRFGTVLQGLRSPYALVIYITAGEKLPDMTAVQSATLSVYTQGSTDDPETWACDIVSQTTDELRLSHVWVAGDNDTPGTLVVYPILTTVSGAIFCEPVRVTILPRN